MGQRCRTAFLIVIVRMVNRAVVLRIVIPLVASVLTGGPLVNVFPLDVYKACFYTMLRRVIVVSVATPYLVHHQGTYRGALRRK